MFTNTNSVNWCQTSVFAKLSGCQKWDFRKENCIFCFCLFMLLQEKHKNKKTKWKMPKNNCKNSVFEVVIQKWEKRIFIKNCLTLFVSGREKKRIFVHTICFGKKCLTKTVKTRKTIINCGFRGNCPKPKNDTFSWKRCFFDMGEKVGFTNCVFEKLKTEKLWNTVGCFWTWQKRVLLFVFQGFNLIVVCLLCVW